MTEEQNKGLLKQLDIAIEADDEEAARNLGYTEELDDALRALDLRGIREALLKREPATEAVLGQFGDWVLEELRGENIGNDLDGGAAQDKAEELGILVRVPVTEPCGERCECAEYGDFPQMCLRRALKGKGASQGDPHDELVFDGQAESGEFVRVPREPTAAMMRAFWLAGPYPEKPWRNGYRAMLAASPDEQKG